MLDLDIDTSIYYSDEFYTGKSLKRLRRKKIKHESKQYIFQHSVKPYKEWLREIQDIPKDKPNRITYPMKYGNECVSLSWRSDTGLFRCTPMGNNKPWYADNKQYSGSHRILYKNFMKNYDNNFGYHRRIYSFQAGKSASGYEMFTRNKRNYNNIPNTWDDLHRSKNYYRNISWKYLSKYKKQWSKFNA